VWFDGLSWLSIDSFSITFANPDSQGMSILRTSGMESLKIADAAGTNAKGFLTSESYEEAVPALSWGYNLLALLMLILLPGNRAKGVQEKRGESGNDRVLCLARHDTGL
jgi:hypothetical protein